MSEHGPSVGLREVVHQRVRLGILAVLSRRRRATFTELREALGQSDGALSRHLGVLESHELIETEKVFENRRPRTWVQMTDSGRAAFLEEQAQLAQLLASASNETSDSAAGGDDDGTVAMAVVFAALLDRDDAARADDDRVAAEAVDYSALLPASANIPGLDPTATTSGPISARYEFPASHATFGVEQQEQRLMFMSHGLRGGWIATWTTGATDPADAVSAQAMVVELGTVSDCEAVLRIMGTSTLSLDAADDDRIRAYLLPPTTADGPLTALAWFSSERFVVSLVVVARELHAVTILRSLVTETGRLLAAGSV